MTIGGSRCLFCLSGQPSRTQASTCGGEEAREAHHYLAQHETDPPKRTACGTAFSCSGMISRLPGHIGGKGAERHGLLLVGGGVVCVTQP